jgi:GTP cyclohydrolase I
MTAAEPVDGPAAAPGDEGVDLARAEKAVRELLEAVGEDPSRDGLLDTPGRVARMYAEALSGLHANPDHHLTVTFEAEHDEMVMVRDIPFASLCEHHLLPFSGRAHVAYIPGSDGRVTGCRSWPGWSRATPGGCRSRSA